MAATRRIEQKAATRDKVIAAARHLFTSQGYEATGIREIAKAAGVSTGAILGTFSGKLELFKAARPHLPDPDPRELLIALARDVHVGNLTYRAQNLVVALYGVGAL